MGMIQTLKVIDQMEVDGVIGRYAIGGAFAAAYYVEPTLTEDLDILLSFEGGANQGESGLVTLQPIFSYLKGLGYAELQRGGVVVEGWPVEFIPVADNLDAEALAQAKEVDIDENSRVVRTRVLTAEHIVAICLRVGRPKDFIRITQFLDGNVLEMSVLCAILNKHGLAKSWQSFCVRNGISNPCNLSSGA
jgi:hypothetical protein